MSLYNLIHGHNPMAPVLLACLGITPSDVPRYRDTWWDGEQGCIAVHTRTGGGNRDMYEHEQRARQNYPEYFEGDDPPSGPWNADLRKLPTFVYDEDDDYDSTYATFYFKMPEKLAWVIPHLSAQDKSPGDRWTEFMDKMRDPASADDPQVKKALGAMEPLFAQIAEAFKPGDASASPLPDQHSISGEKR